MKHFIRCYQHVWGLKFTFFRVRQKMIIWFGVSMTLNLMSWACKGYTSISGIETFYSNVKQKVLNEGKTLKH